MYGQKNELYEGAIRTHDQHNRIHGYDMKVLRETIVNTFWSRPTYLLSLIAAELEKPQMQRSEWIMWFDPDVLLLNPQIPLEVFLPPRDFDGAHFLGTHDSSGFNDGIFFLRIHEWSVRLLVDILNIPNSHPEIEKSADKGQRAFDLVLRSSKFCGQVIYQPRIWYNAFQHNATSFEGVDGDIHVHFHDLYGDKWAAMADTLSRLSTGKHQYSIPFKETTYEREVNDFWERLRRAYQLLSAGQVRANTGDKSVFEPMQMLSHATVYETDDEVKMISAITAVENALG